MNDISAPAEPATEPPANQQWSRFREATFQVVIAWSIYVLSIGPLYWQWYAGKYVHGPTIISALYEPLWRLCGYISPLRWFVNWYVSLWIL